MDNSKSDETGDCPTGAHCSAIWSHHCLPRTVHANRNAMLTSKLQALARLRMALLQAMEADQPTIIFCGFTGRCIAKEGRYTSLLIARDLLDWRLFANRNRSYSPAAYVAAP